MITAGVSTLASFSFFILSYESWLFMAGFLFLKRLAIIFKIADYCKL